MSYTRKSHSATYFFLYLPKIHYLGGFLTLHSSHEHDNRARFFIGYLSRLRPRSAIFRGKTFFVCFFCCIVPFLQAPLVINVSLWKVSTLPIRPITEPKNDVIDLQFFQDKKRGLGIHHFFPKRIHQKTNLSPGRQCAKSLSTPITLIFVVGVVPVTPMPITYACNRGVHWLCPHDSIRLRFMW